MAVLSLREVLPRVSSHRFGENPSATMKFVCTLDGPTSHLDIISAIGYSFGSPYPDGLLVCLEVNISEPDYFHAEVEYNFGIPDRDDQGFVENPLERPDVWSYTASTSTIPAETYYEGTGNTQIKPLTNTAGEQLFGVTTQTGELKVQITGNRATFDAALATSVVGCVNSDAYLGANPYTWQCNGISGKRASETVGDVVVWYWEVSVSLTYRARGWQAYLLNVGMNVRDSSGRLAPATVTSESGAKVRASMPVALAPNGQQYPDPSPEPDVLVRRLHPAVAFVPLFGVPS